MSATLKNVKIAKYGDRHIITIPSKLIKHNVIDPETRYDVALNPTKNIEKAEVKN